MSESWLLETNSMMKKTDKLAEMKVLVWPRNLTWKNCSLSKLAPRLVSMSNNFSKIWQQIYLVFKVHLAKLIKVMLVLFQQMSEKEVWIKTQDSNWQLLVVKWVPNKNLNKSLRTKKGMAAAHDWPSIMYLTSKCETKTIKQIEILDAEKKINIINILFS